MENTGRDELDRAKVGTTSQRAEPRPGRLLEERALAGAKKNAVQQRAWIFFQDETGFSQQPSIRRTWAPRGKTPILRSRGNHWTRTSVAAALGFRWDGRKTRLFARTKADSFNAESLIVFLKDPEAFCQRRQGHPDLGSPTGTSLQDHETIPVRTAKLARNRVAARIRAGFESYGRGLE